jgi:hypothetical protein
MDWYVLGLGPKLLPRPQREGEPHFTYEHITDSIRILECIRHYDFAYQKWDFKFNRMQESVFLKTHDFKG